jgi:hypothetical protein
LISALTGCHALEHGTPAQDPTFEIRSTGEPEYTRRIHATVENIIMHYWSLFAVQDVRIPRITIVLGGEEDDYDPEEHPALYDTSSSSIHFRRKPDTMLLMHEIAHHFIRFRLGEVPVWLNEGLATYLGWSAVDRDHIVLGEVPVVYFRTLRALAREGALMPMEEFLTCTAKRFYESSQSAGNYAQAWGFIFFLLHCKMPSNGSFHSKLDRINRMSESQMIAMESSFIKFCSEYSAVQLMVERLESRDLLRKLSNAFRLGLLQEGGALDALLKLARDQEEESPLREVALFAAAMIVMRSRDGQERSLLYQTLGVIRHQGVMELREAAEILLDAFFREEVGEIVARFAALGSEQTFYPASRFIVIPEGETGAGGRTVKKRNPFLLSSRPPGPPSPP